MNRVSSVPIRPIAELARNKPCGTRLRYLAGCHCALCRKANTDYERARARARKGGDWNGIVSAEEARAHILWLRKQGVGRRAVAAASDVPQTIIQRIAAGRAQCRARTARKILAVKPYVASDHACISARRTWRMIAQLREEQYKVGFLAKRLGFSGKGLHFGKKRVTAKTQYRVERLFQELMT